MKTRVSLAVGTVLIVLNTPLIFGASFESNLEKSFSAQPGGKLVLRADQGSIEVVPNSGQEVHIRVLRTVPRGTKGDADRTFANHEVIFQHEGDQVSVTATRKNTRLFNSSGLDVRFEITMPERFHVELKTAGGDVHAGRLDGRAVIKTSSGTIKLDGVSGAVEAVNAGGNILVQESGASVVASTSSGSIQIHKTASSVDASNAGGNIQIDDAGGPVTAKTSSGNIILGAVKGDVEARNAGGTIKAERVTGNVNASTSSGSIQLGTVNGNSVNVKNAGGSIGIAEVDGSITAETSSGSIKIGAVKGKVEAKNAGGNIDIGDVGGNASAQTSSGAVKIKAVRGTLIVQNSGGDIAVAQAGGDCTLRTSSGTIRVGTVLGTAQARNSGGGIRIANARGTVQASTSSGNLEVAFGATPPAECRLEANGGGISLALPSDVKLDLDARASGGRIISDMPLVLTVQGEHMRDALKGKINDGGSVMYLRASAGDIRLKAGPASATVREVEDPEK